MSFKKRAACQRTLISKRLLIYAHLIVQKNLWEAKKATHTFRKKRLNQVTKLFALALIILSGHVVAEDYCFEQKVSLNEAKAYVKDVLLPKDKVGIREIGHCLEISVSENRKELVMQYLTRRYGRVTQSGASSKRDYQECLFEITQTMDGNRVEDELKVASNRRTVVTRGEVTEGSKSVSTLRLAEGRYGSLEVNDTQIDLRCLQRGRGFELEVRMLTDKGNISTSIEIQKGVSIDLGQTVEDLNEKSRKVGVPVGVNYKKSTGKRIKRYSLILR